MNFREVAEQIAALASNPALLPISIGVFGTWGTGKSTVLKLAESRLLKPKEGAKQEAADDYKSGLPIVVKFDAPILEKSL